MFCPSCGSEFRAGISRCANCEVDLVDEVPDTDPFSSQEKMAELLEGKELVPIALGAYTAVRDMQMDLVKARVPSVIAPESGDELQPGVHERVQLMVAESDVERVRTSLREAFARGVEVEGVAPPGTGAVDVSDTEATACPACGTEVAPTVEECPECGLFIGAAAGDDGDDD